MGFKVTKHHCCPLSLPVLLSLFYLITLGDIVTFKKLMLNDQIIVILTGFQKNQDIKLKKWWFPKDRKNYHDSQF